MICTVRYHIVLIDTDTKSYSQLKDRDLTFRCRFRVLLKQCVRYNLSLTKVLYKFCLRFMLLLINDRKVSDTPRRPDHEDPSTLWTSYQSAKRSRTQPSPIAFHDNAFSQRIIHRHMQPTSGHAIVQEEYSILENKANIHIYGVDVHAARSHLQYAPLSQQFT